MHPKGGFRMASSAAPATAGKHWKLSLDLDGIAWRWHVRTDERSYSLNTEVLNELNAVIDQLESESPTGLILMSGKPGSFIVDADIREFDATDDADELRSRLVEVHNLFARIEKLPFPTAVAFEGHCLGGGLELALCFDHRIARNTDNTRIGFPEVNLDIYPGFVDFKPQHVLPGVAGLFEDRKSDV